MTGGVSGGGLLGGTSAPVGGGGASAWAPAAGLSGGGLAGGATAGAPDGGVGPVVAPPDGGASAVGQPGAGATLPAHDHTTAAGGGVIDYARLVVSATPPGAPADPSDAFWLNPSEVA